MQKSFNNIELSDIHEYLYRYNFPTHLQNPNGRILLTSAYLLRRKGYVECATQLEQMAIHIMKNEIKLEQYVKIRCNGSSCIVEPKEAEQILLEDQEHKYEVKEVWMTKEEFENLPEFEGF